MLSKKEFKLKNESRLKRYKGLSRKRQMYLNRYMFLSQREKDKLNSLAIRFFQSADLVDKSRIIRLIDEIIFTDEHMNAFGDKIINLREEVYLQTGILIEI